jgi:hypothetical protein
LKIDQVDLAVTLLKNHAEIAALMREGGVKPPSVAASTRIRNNNNNDDNDDDDNDDKSDDEDDDDDDDDDDKETSAATRAKRAQAAARRAQAARNKSSGSSALQRGTFGRRGIERLLELSGGVVVECDPIVVARVRGAVDMRVFVWRAAATLVDGLVAERRAEPLVAPPQHLELGLQQIDGGGLAPHQQHQQQQQQQASSPATLVFSPPHSTTSSGELPPPPPSNTNNNNNNNTQSTTLSGVDARRLERCALALRLIELTFAEHRRTAESEASLRKAGPKSVICFFNCLYFVDCCWH